MCLGRGVKEFLFPTLGCWAGANEVVCDTWAAYGVFEGVGWGVAGWAVSWDGAVGVGV